MNRAKPCPHCDADQPAMTADGLCANCMMAVALGDESENPEFAPTMQSANGFRPPSAAALADSFPHIEILETLGYGGMGAVYKARQKKLDRLVALKIVRPDNTDDVSFTERFNREAKTLARLNHPGIVGVYDFGDVDYVDETGKSTKLFYFLMEYVDGVNLRRLMQTERTRPAQALPLVMQICEALQYAHSQGIVHRDIKPENILLDAQGRVKIADFGLAKLSDGDDLRLTGTRQVLGTLQYMAPEQMSESRQVDHRADIYSTGVVLYEMLTGEVPAGVFEPPSQRAGVDNRLDALVMRALASDPEKRFQTAAEVGSQISSISSIKETEGPAYDSNYVAGPSTIIENGVAAVAAGFKGLLDRSPEVSDDDDLGKTDITLSRYDVENDQLPDICIVSGQPTMRRMSREFSYTPPAAGWVIVVLMVLFFPLGILAAIMFSRKVRATIPVSRRHRNHWNILGWWAGLGWMLILVGVFGGLFVGGFIDTGYHYSRDEPFVLVMFILAGVASYVIPLVWLGTTRVAVDEISDHTITLKRTSVKFARACRRYSRSSAPPEGADQRV